MKLHVLALLSLLLTGSLFAQADWTILQREASVLLRDIDRADANTLYAIGGDEAGGVPLGVLLRSTDNGESWEELAVPFATTDRMFALDFATPDLGWAVGEAGLIFRTTDGGATWNNQLSGTDRQLRDVYFLDENTGWITGGDNDEDSYLVLKTTDGGLTWQDLSFGDSSFSSESIYFVDANNGWLSGNKNLTLHPQIHRTTDGGLTWTEQVLPAAIAEETATVTGVAFADTTTGYAVANSLYTQVPILGTTDGGTTWEILTYTDRDYHHLAVRDAQSVAVVGTAVLGGGADKLYVSTDGGTSFAAYNLPVRNYAGGVLYSEERILIVSDQSIILRSEADGAGLEVIREAPRLNAIAWQDALNGWITSGYVTGTAPFSLRTGDGGNTWTEVPGAPGGVAIDFLAADPDRGWLLYPGQQPRLWRTTDGGDNWLVKQVSNGGTFLEDFFFVDEHTGWVFGSNGAIRKTTNGGVNFSFQDLDDTGLFVQDLYFSDPNRGYCAGGFGSGNGFVYQSTDGGDTWTPKPLAYTEQVLDMSWLDAQTGWACTVGGYVQRTTDAGNTWTAVDSVPHLFAESIEMTSPTEGYLVARDKTGAFEAGQGFVYTTTDGGDTWELAFQNDYVEGSFSGFAINPDGNPWVVGNHNTIAYRGDLVSASGRPRPARFDLSTAPNPFVDAVTFRFEVARSATVGLYVFDARGRLVHQRRQRRVAGAQRWTWSAEQLPAGTYTYVLEVAGIPTAGTVVRH